MGLIVTTPPAVGSYVISLDAAKAYLRIDGDSDDDTLSDLIADAHEFIQVETQQQIFTATKLLTLDSFPGHVGYGQSAGGVIPMAPDMYRERGAHREIRLPTPPLQSVSSVTYVWQGETLTLSPSLYTVDAVGMPGRVVLNGGQEWPNTDAVANAVSVQFICGYSTPASVPRRFGMAIKWLIGHTWENRAAVAQGLKFETLPIGLQTVIEGLMFRDAYGA